MSFWTASVACSASRANYQTFVGVRHHGPVRRIRTLGEFGEEIAREVVRLRQLRQGRVHVHVAASRRDDDGEDDDAKAA